MNNIFKSVAVIALLLLCSQAAISQEQRFRGEWQAVRIDTDGLEIPEADFIGYRMYYSNGSPVTPDSDFIAVMPDDTEADLRISLPPGQYTYYFGVTALRWSTNFSDPAFPDGVKTSRESALQPAPESGPGGDDKQAVLLVSVNSGDTDPAGVVGLTITFIRE